MSCIGSRTTKLEKGRRKVDPIHTTKYCNISSIAGISSASSFVEMVIVGRMRNYGYGSMPMEKSFRDCSISAGDSSGHVGINHNLGWVGVDPYNSSTHANFFDKIRPSDQETLEEEAENIGATKILACVHVHLRSNSVLGRTSVPVGLAKAIGFNNTG
ncbi:hypothetical protein JHK86_035222 [Glycine max]|nr:hypothetical protein JHK86_035222 [Glycine max]